MLCMLCMLTNHTVQIKVYLLRYLPFKLGKNSLRAHRIVLSCRVALVMSAQAVLLWSCCLQHICTSSFQALLSISVACCMPGRRAWHCIIVHRLEGMDASPKRPSIMGPSCRRHELNLPVALISLD